jgi:hypothetical protein
LEESPVATGGQLVDLLVADRENLAGFQTISQKFIWGNFHYRELAVCQNPIPLVNIKIAGKWMFIPLKMVSIGIDPYPYGNMMKYS